jgi:preprotein translocase subunit SecF
MELLKPGTKIPFTRYRKIAFLLSTLVNLAVLVVLFVRGPNLGVDFAGGTMIHLKFHQDVTIAQIREALHKNDLEPGEIQDFGEPSAHEFLIRMEKSDVELGTLAEEVSYLLEYLFVF